MNILQTNNLYKTYGKQVVLDGLAISVPKGSIYGLVGKNGAGKTTLIRMICGLQKQNVGDLIIMGTPNTSPKINEVRRKIGAIVETPALHLNMTAHENLKMQMLLLENYDKAKADEWLDFVGLSKTGNKHARYFSLGMRQRLAIAIALCGNPELLVLDEPINGLDPQGIIEVRELLLKINKEKGITILVSSHLLDELARVATHYGFIDKGKLVAEMTAETLTADPERKTTLHLNHVNGLVMAMTKFQNKFELLDDKTLVIYGPIEVTDLVLALHEKGIVVHRIVEKSESLEDRFFELLGGDNHA
jgi:ABC-2 type transport system ATP-binding protein